MRLALTALLVGDYDDAIDFYVRKVGFDLVEDAVRQPIHCVALRVHGLRKHGHLLRL